MGLIVLYFFNKILSLLITFQFKKSMITFTWNFFKLILTYV